MTRAHKLKTLLAILDCSPAAQSTTVFESAVRTGDLELFWTHYQDALRKIKNEETPRLVTPDAISLDMLEPAMNAVYSLPTRD